MRKFATEAIARMQEMAGDDRPFFLAVGFKKPHVPLKAPQEYFDLFEAEQIPLPPDFDTRPTIGYNVPVDELRENIDLYSAREFFKRPKRVRRFAPTTPAFPTWTPRWDGCLTNSID